MSVISLVADDARAGALASNKTSAHACTYFTNRITSSDPR